MAPRRLQPEQHANARTMRNAPTLAESRLWPRLKDRRLGGWRFNRQVAIGPFIVDFACRAARLAVEVEGEWHVIAVAADTARTAKLERHGYRVIRFWNSEVASNLDGVAVTILAACEGAAAQVARLPAFGRAPPPPAPSRRREGEKK